MSDSADPREVKAEDGTDYEQKTVQIRPNKRWLEKRVNDLLFDRTASFEDMIEVSAINRAQKELKKPDGAAALRKCLKDGSLKMCFDLSGGKGRPTVFTVVGKPRKKPERGGQ